MKKVSIYSLKQELSSLVAEAESGVEVLITRHNKPVARLTSAGTKHLHRGSRFGDADLRPAMRAKTGGRYLEVLDEDRRRARS